MSHFEIVRTDADQSWHGRRVVNGKNTWTTETMARQVGVERAIAGLISSILVEAGHPRARVNIERQAVYVDGLRIATDLRYVDERGAR